jgi:hypothetical protein
VGEGAVERLTAVPGERKANLQVTRSTTIDEGGRDASYVGHNTAKERHTISHRVVKIRNFIGCKGHSYRKSHDILF